MMHNRLHKYGEISLEQILYPFEVFSTFITWYILSLMANTPEVCEQHPTKQQLTSITKAIKVRRTRHAGHCWRSKDKLISDVLLWTPSHRCAKVGRPARTYILRLCADTGYSPEDPQKAIEDKEGWRERTRDIRADYTTWWWPIFTRSNFS